MAIIKTAFDTTTNKDLLKGTLRKLHDDTVREAKVEYPTVCNDLKTKDIYERDAKMAGLQYPGEISEGQGIPIQTPAMGTNKTYTQRQFGTGFRMTHKMNFFNKFNLWKRWTKDLAKVMKEGKDVEIATMFNNLTSTSLTCGTGFDSMAIANDAHTGLNPNTTSDNYDNYLNAALSQSGLESMRYYFSTLKDDMGYWMGAKATHLVIEPTLYFTAKELLGSDNKAHEFSNTVNILAELVLKLFEYHRLTSTTCWFGLCKDSKYDINVFTALEPKMFIKDAPDNTLDMVAIAIQYYTYGWGNPKQIYVGKT